MDSVTPKHSLASKTIWAGIASVVAGLGGVAQVVGDGTVSTAEIEPLITSVLALAGGIGAIYGRIVATQEIKA